VNVFACLLLMVAAVLDPRSYLSNHFEKQQGFIRDCGDASIQYVSAFCGLQAGKTLGECDGARAALYLSDKPLELPAGMVGTQCAEVWLVSKNYKLAETLFETFRARNGDLFLTEKQIKRYGLTRGDKNTYFLAPRSMVTGCKSKDPMPIKVRVRTQSDPESLRAANTVILIVGDEYAWWKEKSILNAFGRAIVTRTKFILGTTPHGKNAAYRLVALPGGYGGGKRNPLYAVHAWTSADNPHADKDHIERLRKMFGREYAKQELEGLFTDAIGYVFPTFDRTKHVRPLPSQDPADYEKIVGGIDPGFTDAYAGTVLGKYNGVWHQLWELHETQQTSEDLVPTFLSIQERWKVERWYCDKRRPSDIKDLRRSGVHVVPNIDVYAENDRSTIKPMLACLQGLMERDQLMLGPEQEQTAEEFERYHYDVSEDKEKNTNDVPVDWMNHHVDAIRYAICAVEDLTHAKPRYRKGSSQVPQEIHPEKKVLIPSLQESLAFQDERMDKLEDARMGGQRKHAAHFLRRRAQFRRET
jgi:hypothetical protein